MRGPAEAEPWLLSTLFEQAHEKKFGRRRWLGQEAAGPKIWEGSGVGGCGSKPMVPFWGRCTTHFGLF